MKQFIVLYAAYCLLLATPGNAQPSAGSSCDQYSPALSAIRQYQYEMALELLSSCYTVEPDNPEYLLQIGYCNTQLGRYKDARLFYNQILRRDSLHIEAIIALAGISERENNYRQAAEWYGKLIGLDSLNSYYHKKAGLAALKLGDGMGAVLSFRESYRLNDSDLEVTDQLSSLYLEMDADSSAMQLLRRGLSIDPGNVRLLHNSARLHNKRKHYPALIAVVERSRAQGDSSHYYQMLLAVAYLQLDSLDAGIPLLEDLEAKGKGTEHVYHYLGLGYRKKGELDQGAYWYRKAIDAAISKKTGIYYADLAAIHAEQKDYKSAVELYEKAYGYSGLPKDLFFLAQYCDQYYKDKNIALRHYQRYLNTKDPEYREFVETRLRQIREQQHFNK
jgi:tetratricopeptide (TPR) repeat protein